jgi:hypothetical protein
VLVRSASASELAYMLALRLSSSYPGVHVPLWQNFGAALNHLVLAMCFGAFLVGAPAEALSMASARRRRRKNGIGVVYADEHVGDAVSVMSGR